MKTTNPKSIDLPALLRPITSDLDRVRDRIGEVLTGADWPIGEWLSQLNFGGGKMLRPALVLLSGGCFGPLRPEHLELGAIAEMIHWASLLHDDVIDQAQTRRGRRSANALWGNTQAVLLGDFVLSKAFGLGAALELTEAATVLCRTAEAICTGEIQQNLRKGDLDLTEADYLAIIEGKTASLFGACCCLGALAGQAETSVQNRLRQYGLALGMAFQITDDLLDILGSTGKEGKTLGTDLLNEKVTLPVIYWLRQGNDTQRKDKLAQLRQDSDGAGLCEVIGSSGAVEYTLQRVGHFAREAQNCLEELPDTPAKQVLTGLISYVLHRI